MAHTSSRFQSTTVVCSWKGRPARLQASMPAKVRAWAFGRPRNLSCLAASRLSTEMPMAAAPASFRRRATSSVMSVPLLPNTGRNPREAAWATSS